MMRFIMGFRAAALLAALTAGGQAAAQMHGPGGPGGGGHPGPGFPPPRPGIGVNAYAPGQGPVGVAAWNGGNWNGYTPGGFLPWGGGAYASGSPTGDIAAGNVSNVLTYNHFDNRRRDGGFYGGGGVFYGDDGYSRLPVQPWRDADCAEARAVRSGSPHVIELSGANAPAPVRKKPSIDGARR